MLLGFVGAIYPVKPLKEIAIAGETADAMVSLPQTRATLMAFLEVNSLAKIWNYVVSAFVFQCHPVCCYLSQSLFRLSNVLHGVVSFGGTGSVSDAKELHQLALEKAKIERAKRGRGQLFPASPQATVQK